jgi:hypothetical protein
VRPIYRTGVPQPFRCCILYTFFKINVSTEYFKHAVRSPFFSLKCYFFIMQIFMVHVLFKFYVKSVIKFKCKTPVPKGQNKHLVHFILPNSVTVYKPSAVYKVNINKLRFTECYAVFFIFNILGRKSNISCLVVLVTLLAVKRQWSLHVTVLTIAYYMAHTKHRALP